MLRLILFGWVLACVSGLKWDRLWTMLLTGLTAVGFAATHGWLLVAWQGWAMLAVLIGVPWFLEREQRRQDKQLRQLQQAQAEQAMRLSESARAVLSVEGSAQRFERQIGELIELYHVTKETTRGLHAEDLFRSILDLAPRILHVNALRLLDLSTDTPRAYRANANEDGQLIFKDQGAPDATEAAVLESVAATRPDSPSAQAVMRDANLVEWAWTVLWQEGKPIGALAAEGLAGPQEPTFGIIANQLRLQLSRVRLYQQVEALAVTDALTGLFVRRHFLARAEEELTRSRRHNLSCALLMIDLDLFKQKNDTHGHLVGDVVLRSVAQLLQKHLRDVDLIARYGGEEFVLLLIETNGEQALPVAQRLKQLVEVHPIQAYDELLTQTISVGLAIYPNHAHSLPELIERADQALLMAKRSGRNRVVMS